MFFKLCGCIFTGWHQVTNFRCTQQNSEFLRFLVEPNISMISAMLKLECANSTSIHSYVPRGPREIVPSDHESIKKHDQKLTVANRGLD